MEWSNLTSSILTIGGITIASLGVTNTSSVSQPAQGIQLAQNNPVELVEAVYPNRIEITVKISAHEDLKISQDMQIAKGQIISDRIPEKKRLEAQKKQLELSLERVLSASIQAPPKPRPVPAVAPLPPVNYLEHEAAIERANIAIALSAEEISIKVQEIEELSNIPDLDPIILEHEQAKLKQLQLNHQIAENELELARGKLETAKQKREYEEYQASITKARRVEEQNLAASHYQRQITEYNEKIAQKEIQVTQLQEKINVIQSQIDNLQIVSPYAGEVRSIEFLGQSEDGSIAVRILLKVSSEQ